MIKQLKIKQNDRLNVDKTLSAMNSSLGPTCHTSIFSCSRTRKTHETWNLVVPVWRFFLLTIHSILASKSNLWSYVIHALTGMCLVTHADYSCWSKAFIRVYASVMYVIVCRFVRSITQKRMIPKSWNFVQEMILEYPRSFVVFR